MERYINLKVKDNSSCHNSSNNSNNSNNIHPIENKNINRITFKVKDEKINNYKKTPSSQFTMNNILLRDEMINNYGSSSRYPSRSNSAIEKEVTILQSSFKLTSIDKKINVNNNGLINSALLAYSSHHHLVLRPDDIWFQIINQFTIYVNKYSLLLSDKFVDFKDKKELVVKTKYPILNAPFDQLVLDMSNEIEKNIVDPSIKNWIIPDFTTTTSIDKVVFSVALMSTMKNYFNYKFETECALPQVTLLGTLNDWCQLKERVSKLKEFDVTTSNNISSTSKKTMSDWVDELNPILDKFINSINGDVDKKWWNQIIRYDEESGGSYLSGWITVFCLFDKDNEWIKPIYNNDFSLFNAENKQIWNKIQYDKVSKGYISVPIVLKEGEIEYKSEMYAGHLTASIKNKNTVIPSLDWCLVLNY